MDRSFRSGAARVLGFRVLRSSNPTRSFRISEVATASKPQIGFVEVRPEAVVDVVPRFHQLVFPVSIILKLPVNNKVMHSHFRVRLHPSNEAGQMGQIVLEGLQVL